MDIRVIEYEVKDLAAIESTVACEDAAAEAKDQARHSLEVFDGGGLIYQHLAINLYSKPFQPSNDTTDSNYPHVFEQALYRLTCAFNGKPVLQIAFQFIPGMLASHDWRLRHAGLMAIAALGEGGAKVSNS